MSATLGGQGQPARTMSVVFIHGNYTNAADSAVFFSYHSVNDHINVAPEVESHCSYVDRSLHHAVTTVMAPTRKIFVTAASRVVIPASNIAKTQRIVAVVIRSHSLTPPPITPFSPLCATSPHASARTSYLAAAILHVPVGVNARRLDLVENHPARTTPQRWPLGFADTLPEPDITVVPDASDVAICKQGYGLCLLTSHIPGVENTAADAGSPQWQSTVYSTLFDNNTHVW
ncbi:hypothetical protein PHMEG_00022117 [Phytophthora megakarya]|uniref:Uncharacterized protein n=1 Tax=Phytophthora megakarya TaxID=4795 RepID=A0A225VJI4_9STRA|nr:hypothetical protein PHMEG_00022117 [Phytophthora megakarya]